MNTNDKVAVALLVLLAFLVERSPSLFQAPIAVLDVRIPSLFSVLIFGALFFAVLIDRFLLRANGRLIRLLDWLVS